MPVYDAAFGWTREDDFFVSVVEESACQTVLDLGCGTGRLAIALADAGHDVTGVDPAGASLDAARAKHGAERVAWVEGTLADLPDGAFDLALMTSHVAQFIVEDDEWGSTLARLARSLVPGGRLVFDTRDPRVCAWERWNKAESLRRTALPDGRLVTHWSEVSSAENGVVSFVRVYEFSDGTRVVSDDVVRFRGEEELRATLGSAGFRVEEIFGGWNREPVGASDGELLVVAKRPQAT